jgi:hypothetical protein
MQAEAGEVCWHVGVWRDSPWLEYEAVGTKNRPVGRQLILVPLVNGPLSEMPLGTYMGSR